jgi:hypothetical protein
MMMHIYSSIVNGPAGVSSRKRALGELEGFGTARRSKPRLYGKAACNAG